MSESNAEQFTPPISFSEDGATAEWKISDTETAKLSVADLGQVYHKSKLADKQGAELGQLRTQAETHRTRYGDIDKMLAESDNPDALLAKVREALSGRAKQEPVDPWDEIMGTAKTQEYVTPDQFKALRGDLEALAGKRAEEIVSTRFAANEINAELGHALTATGLPDLQVEEGITLHDALAEIVLAIAPQAKGKKLADITSALVGKFAEALKQRDANAATNAAAQARAQGGSIDDFRGMGVAASGIQEKVNFDDEESVKRFSTELTAGFKALGA